MRLDLDDAKKAELLSNFLGVNIPEMINDNVGSDKNYAQAYRDTKKSQIPAEVVEAAYS